MSDVEDNVREPPVTELERRTWFAVIFGETLEGWFTRFIIVVLLNVSVEDASPTIKWIAGLVNAIVFCGILLMIVGAIRQRRRHTRTVTSKRI